MYLWSFTCVRFRVLALANTNVRFMWAKADVSITNACVLRTQFWMWTKALAHERQHRRYLGISVAFEPRMNITGRSHSIQMPIYNNSYIITAMRVAHGHKSHILRADRRPFSTFNHVVSEPACHLGKKFIRNSQNHDSIASLHDMSVSVGLWYSMGLYRKQVHSKKTEDFHIYWRVMVDAC